MDIIVCVKRVPDTGARIRIAADGRSIDPSGVKYVTNPYDEFALEAAFRTRDAIGEGMVTVLGFGSDDDREILRTALAAGADRAVLLEGDGGMDGLATARALAGEVGEAGPSLVLLGMKAVDDDQQQVGPMLATLLGYPCATQVSEFQVEDGAVTALREVEGGVQTVRIPLPAVLTITKGVYEPRYPSLKGIMAAKKKPLEVKAASNSPSRLLVEALDLPPERKEGRIVGEGPEAVEELIRLLRDEAKVL